MPRSLRVLLALALLPALAGPAALAHAARSPRRRRLLRPRRLRRRSASRGRPGRSWSTATSPTRAGAGADGRHLVRDQLGRQRRAAGEDRRLAGLRRQVLLRRLRVRGPRARSDPRPARRPRQRRRATPTTAASSSTPATTARPRILFLANPRGIQYDAVTRRRHRRGLRRPTSSGTRRRGSRRPGWTLEIRIPFSSLRYDDADPQTWGILLYRNYPRDFRYQLFSRTAAARRELLHLPREQAGRPGEAAARRRTCVVAPYATGQRTRAARTAGSARRSSDGDVDGDARARRQVDARPRTPRSTPRSTPTSRRSSPTSRRSSPTSASRCSSPRSGRSSSRASTCFSTPIQAVYTRTITSPRWGARATGQARRAPPTPRSSPTTRAAAASSCPGPTAPTSPTRTSRPRRRRPRAPRPRPARSSACSATDREVEGGGHNRVVGPGLPVAPERRRTRSPASSCERHRDAGPPDLAAEWDGRSSLDHAAELDWSHTDAHLDWYLRATDIGDDFRADDGFVPQVGYREAYLEVGCTFRPKKGLFSRVRPFVTARYVDGDRTATCCSRRICAGRRASTAAGTASPRSSYNAERDPVGGARCFDRASGRASIVESSPGRSSTPDLGSSGFVGDEVDFANARPGAGAVTLSARRSGRPTTSSCALNASRRWLDVDAPRGRRPGACSPPRSSACRRPTRSTPAPFLRLIGQYVRADQRPRAATTRRGRRPEPTSFTGSALFAYKLNWQTVLFLGYGDERAPTPPATSLEPRRPPAVPQGLLRLPALSGLEYDSG